MWHPIAETYYIYIVQGILVGDGIKPHTVQKDTEGSLARSKALLQLPIHQANANTVLIFRPTIFEMTCRTDQETMILSASLLEHMDSLYLTGNEIGDLEPRYQTEYSQLTIESN